VAFGLSSIAAKAIAIATKSSRGLSKVPISSSTPATTLASAFTLVEDLSTE
jgi:hypothetical protein